MGIHIVAGDALGALAEAVNERGEDYVYQPEYGSGTCRNWHEETDEPGCIVGLAMTKLGVSAEVMRARATGGVDTLRSDLKGAGVTMTNAAANVFKFAQVAQDGKATWGVALAMANLTIDVYGGDDE